jgi:hypothetical protein
MIPAFCCFWPVVRHWRWVYGRLSGGRPLKVELFGISSPEMSKWLKYQRDQGIIERF